MRYFLSLMLMMTSLYASAAASDTTFAMDRNVLQADFAELNALERRVLDGVETVAPEQQGTLRLKPLDLPAADFNIRNMDLTAFALGFVLWVPGIFVADWNGLDFISSVWGCAFGTIAWTAFIWYLIAN